jgi:hypothetical protein
MKPILASILLLLSTDAHAQFSLGLSGGVNAFSNFRNQNNNTWTYAEDRQGPVDKLTSKPTWSLQGYWTTSKWQYGFSIDGCLMPDLKDAYIPGTVFSMSEWPKMDERIVSYKYALPVKLFANRIVKLRHWSLSGGLSAGYIFKSDIYNQFFFQPFTFNNTGCYGLMGGAQVGASYKCSRHFSVNARVAEEYIYSHQDDIDRISYTNTSLILGAAYTF